ncbi:hypothetical protein D9619_011987 [Psilocybe cf. subviscida]|uniref:Secreted protein n=1 Tax=Psilocybe cf. subviscida TaxID=2480587 RepID=A0A8H5B237_9AGAR|nr:hypothetical protein D9619_011987 [Psilocybe cf. subviscida]
MSPCLLLLAVACASYDNPPNNVYAITRHPSFFLGVLVHPRQQAPDTSAHIPTPARLDSKTLLVPSLHSLRGASSIPSMALIETFVSHSLIYVFAGPARLSCTR